MFNFKSALLDIAYPESPAVTATADTSGPDNGVIFIVLIAVAAVAVVAAAVLLIRAAAKKSKQQ